MTRREKILAGAVALLVVAAVLIYGGKKIVSAFVSRSDRIVELQEEISGKEIMQRRGTIARRTLDEYAARALPEDKELANSRYRAWLHEWCSLADIERANVKYISRQQVLADKDVVYDKLTFSLNCQAELPQLVKLLYEFYRQDYLHRIKSMKATPLENDKRLAVNFLIEAASMPGVADRELADMPSARLAFDSIDQYQNVIVGRNIYSPANKPPKFASSSTQQGFLNRPMSFAPEAADPEKGRLTYRVEHDGLDGLEIDERTGQIRWTPNALGEYEILVYAVDDGLPAKESSQSIRLAISEPPPEPKREDPPPARGFDEAKTTFVTGIVEVSGRPQVWLDIRTTGDSLRLFEGDTFQIGEVNGEVIVIEPRQVKIRVEGKTYVVRIGQSIYDGQVVAEAEDGVAAM